MATIHEPSDATEGTPHAVPTEVGAATTTSTSETATQGEPDTARKEGGHVCPVGFCPIGAAVNSLGAVRPDAMAHLLVAGREFLLAARAVVDARADEVDEAVDEAVNRFQKIDIG
ncbi:MAG: hypothetical protein WD206_04915 [Actinomycetota bacterium]